MLIEIKNINVTDNFNTMPKYYTNRQCYNSNVTRSMNDHSFYGTSGGSVVEWLGCWIHGSRIEGSPPGHDSAWLFISETGDRLLAGKLS